VVHHRARRRPRHKPSEGNRQAIRNFSGIERPGSRDGFLQRLGQDPEDWALLTKQSGYKDGITDDEAVVLTVLPGQTQSVPTDYQSLADNRFYMEKITEPLTLSGSVDLYLVRFLEHQTESATMTHLRSTVLAIEN
jgi:hypothetical protein